MHKLTGEEVFQKFADRWSAYQASWLKGRRALVQKAVFKLLYY
jgi:hypothetical protein